MEFKINQYDSIITDRYNGKYQIKVGSVWTDGKFHQDFKKFRTKDGTEKSIPVTLTFEDDKTAEDLMVLCLTEVTGKIVVLKSREPEQAPLDDVPF